MCKVEITDPETYIKEVLIRLKNHPLSKASFDEVFSELSRRLSYNHLPPDEAVKHQITNESPFHKLITTFGFTLTSINEDGVATYGHPESSSHKHGCAKFYPRAHRASGLPVNTFVVYSSSLSHILSEGSWTMHDLNWIHKYGRNLGITSKELMLNAKKVTKLEAAKEMVLTPYKCEVNEMGEIPLIDGKRATDAIQRGLWESIEEKYPWLGVNPNYISELLK